MQQLSNEERKQRRSLERKKRQEERSRERSSNDSDMFQISINGNIISKDKEQSVKILLLESDES